MSNDKNKRKQITTVIIMIVMIIAAYFGIDISGFIPNDATGTPTTEVSSQEQNEDIINIQATDDVVILTMIDVGQGDCFLIEHAGKVMLIDCGEEDTATEVVNFLKQKGITRIDNFYGTHWHSDHIGAMYHIITNFEVGKIYLPKMKTSLQLADWCTKLRKELKKEKYDVQYIALKEEFEYNFDELKVKVMGPKINPEDELNNYSIVQLLSFGEMDILFTGDAEKEIEKALIESDENIDVEILKVGHHGSNTSSTAAFLDETSPDYALISCGLGNIHKHPTEKIMERLESRDIEVYRTDESGTVVATITKDSVTFSCKPGDYLSGLQLREKEGIQ